MRQVDVVCYTSKRCNLRCRYCYELALLADRTRMSLDQIERMFQNFASWAAACDEAVALRFAWHGGEPMLIEPDFYWQAFERQRATFSGSGVRVSNAVQTNMTVLDDARIALLHDGFDNVGVSLDVFGALRVSQRGRCVQASAIANLERAVCGGVTASGITVLGRHNVAHVDDIYHFWRDRGMDFRLLPMEKGLYDLEQGLELEPNETLGALCRLADLWLCDDHPVAVEPLMTHLGPILHAARAPGNRTAPYDPVERESVILVDTDGTLYSHGERFEPAGRRGNIFQTPYADVLAGERHRASAEARRRRMRDTCSSCAHYRRTCTGHPIADGAMEFVDHDSGGALRCTVARGFISHIQRRLAEAGIIDAATGAASAALRAAQHHEHA